MSSSSSSSASAAFSRANPSRGDLVFFGNNGYQLRDFSNDSGDAMAESIAMGNGAAEDEDMRAAIAASAISRRLLATLKRAALQLRRTLRSHPSP